MYNLERPQLTRSARVGTVPSGAETQRIDRWDSAAKYPLPVTPIRYAAAKRAMDVVISLAAIILLSPLLLLIALLVKITSHGPVIFRQQRSGLGGSEFTCLKFRSMCQDAERKREEIAHLNEASGPVFKIRNDPRVTPVGRVIRKLSLDELPQLFNVLRGEMSIVGPRPPLPSEVATYSAREQRRLSVKPGITCIWQISGRSDVSFDRWVELDIEYIETMSFWNDVSIFLRTFPAVLTARGAH
jgi:exopolysaccharide biosynthesis polyprenyl glycosylphosphotransferase